MAGSVEDALRWLDIHCSSFFAAKPFADKTMQPIPSDTAAWSQILVSLLTGIDGLARKKGADLADGSDVKGANVWCAIDTPRFNGAIPAGRVSTKSKKPANVSALDDIPYLFFVLWDSAGSKEIPRCRIWCVRTQHDPVFRGVAAEWYRQRADGFIRSANFQLHPPRNLDTNVVRNTCGNMAFPLLFCAHRIKKHFEMISYDPNVLSKGKCELIT